MDSAAQRSSRPFVLWLWSLLRLDFVGLIFGALFFCLSLTPSLLPRPWLFGGLIGGINAAIGYGLGVLVGIGVYRLFLRQRSWWPPAPRIRLAVKAITVIGSVTACLLMVIPAAGWQRELAALMDMPGPATLGYFRVPAVAAVMAIGLISTWRVLVDAVRLLARWMIRRWRVNGEVALFIGTSVVVVLLVTLVNGVLVRGFMAGASAVFQPQNAVTAPDVRQPTLAEKSGSPASFAPWETLGFQGRNFVAGGPDAARIAAVNGRPAKEPIRVYVGLQTAETDEERIAVLLSELARTHAFERRLLVVVPTTGTGWINPVAAAAIELMYDGDIALVGLQYSYLPSWISFAADRTKAIESGRMLIDAVHQRWAQLPAQSRPALALYGESLGSMAGQGAFAYLPDIALMGFESVLWVGPPNASPVWSAVVARRDPGSTEVTPRYDGGRTVRFSPSADPADIARDGWDYTEPKTGTRVLFLQHPSDPIVWWSPELLFNRPDWLAEPRGRDRTLMRWYPIITFWQISVDVTNAGGVPDGHGHNYGDAVLDGWAAVAPPDGWTLADTERIRAALHAPQ